MQTTLNISNFFVTQSTKFSVPSQMGTPSSALYSFKNPLLTIYNPKTSARHFNKHLVCTTHSSINYPLKAVKFSPLPPQRINSADLRRGIHLKPLNSAITDNFTSILELKPKVIVEKVEDFLTELTVFGFCKWVFVTASVVAVCKWFFDFVFNPVVWMYFSWTWLFWPWFVAIGIGIYGVYSFRKHSIGESSVIEQLAIVTSVFTWLTLVPPAFFNGFLEGWPFVFFFVYHYFFFFNVSIRKRLYGDYNPRPHDPKWDIQLPNWYQSLFAVGVVVGHWLAAFEGPELHLVSGGWTNFPIWGLIMATLFMHYNASLYLANYSEKVVLPTAVVQFGPYRWVRHPIYASTMLLFLTYFIALRAPLSCLYIVAVCVLYYDQKAKAEEALMMETFGEGYLEYSSKVRYKFIPFVY